MQLIKMMDNQSYDDWILILMFEEFKKKVMGERKVVIRLVVCELWFVHEFSVGLVLDLASSATNI